MNKNFLVIPSIDIKDEKTVRVVQGIPELNCEEYGNNPVDMARIWRAENAKLIHIVDFDSAAHHVKKNWHIVEEICNSVIIPVEFAGGIRNIEDAKLALKMGVCRIVLTTMAIDSRNEFIKLIEEIGASKISVALDIVKEEIVVHARTVKTGLNYLDFAKDMAQLGVTRFIVTDVERNGLLGGPNLEYSKKVAETTGMHVTVSGGVRNKDELIDIKKLAEIGVDSVIIGRALYENRFPCQKLWRVAEAGIFN